MKNSLVSAKKSQKQNKKLSRQKLSTITESSATLHVYSDHVVSKKLPVFYNPLMKSNRDLTILLLNAVDNTQMRMLDLMAGSGIRAIRLIKELHAGKIKELAVNDANSSAISLIKKNFALNKIKTLMTGILVSFSNKTADELLSTTRAYDYIDIDPFGTPNPFLDLACKKIKNHGILAVTATDTAPLCGTYPKACRRKYWAEPLRDERQHEFAVRILIRKIQLVGAQYDKALTPICSIAKQHYIRLFFKVTKSKEAVDHLLSLHGLFEEKTGVKAGPLWLGSLHDPKIIDVMKKNADENKSLQKFLDVLSQESCIPTVGFFDLHTLASEMKIPLPKMETIIGAVKKKNHQASKTIFSEKGLRTTLNEKNIRKILMALHK